MNALIQVTRVFKCGFLVPDHFGCKSVQSQKSIPVGGMEGLLESALYFRVPTSDTVNGLSFNINYHA
jgi:hypothetical protein